MKDCKHQWYVYSAFHQDRGLMVECLKCRAFGDVEEPTKQEWNDAVNAQEPYLWQRKPRAVDDQSQCGCYKNIMVKSV